ncbi:MAG TPA: site-specific integrase [Trebonia sp.]|jgi:integrase
MSTTTTSTSTELAAVRPAFSDSERLALAGYLAGYRGMTREAYTLDLRQFTIWCRDRSLPLFEARRADIETFARELEDKGRARATVTRRLSTIAGFYKYAVEEELPDHPPAAHVRRPRLDYESHATGLDRNEAGAILVAAGLGPAAEHALISLLALNGLRVSEAAGADVEHMGLERGHRTLTVTRKGGKVVTGPARPAHRPRDRPGHRRAHRRAAVPRGRRQETGPARRRPDRPPRHPPRRDRQERRPAHPAARVHNCSARRRRPAARCPGGRLARRPAHHDALRPGTDQPGPARHLHRRHVHRRSGPVTHDRSPEAWGGLSRRGQAAPGHAIEDAITPRRCRWCTGTAVPDES